MRIALTAAHVEPRQSESQGTTTEKRLDGRRHRRECPLVVTVIYSNEPDPQAEQELDRLLAPLLKVKPCN
jgi:hypothetical protein